MFVVNLQNNIGSVYIFVKLPKRTYAYNSMQFPAELNTCDSYFHTNYDYMGRLSVNKDIFAQFLTKYYVMT